MTKYSHSSTRLRRQPKQKRGRERVEKILDAAAEVFDEMGYAAATTHQIAAKAGTAIGSLYQFFPDKAAIFHAMELRHTERVKTMWSATITPEMIQLPLREMIQVLTGAIAKLFEQPVSRVVFVQFYTAREIFQSIDETMTQEAIKMMASILQQRNSQLSPEKCHLLAEVCVHSGNAVMLEAFRHPDPNYSQQLFEQIGELIFAYLQPYIGDNLSAKVMKVMKCPHCQSLQLSKNGRRRGQQCYLCKKCGKQFIAAKVI